MPRDLLGPELRIDLNLFYQAFSELSSCRHIGEGEGPIPWTAIRVWCEEFRLSGQEREDVFYYVREMDLAYLKYNRSKKK